VHEFFFSIIHTDTDILPRKTEHARARQNKSAPVTMKIVALFVMTNAHKERVPISFGSLNETGAGFPEAAVPI
jgi:hypothetical protein